MKGFTLTLIAALSLNCSALPRYVSHIKTNDLPNKINEWYSNPSYKGVVGEGNIVDIEIKSLDSSYYHPHLVLYYDLDNNGKNDLRAFFRVNLGEILRHPTMVVCDINEDGKGDITWIDINNDGIRDFEK